ncbi:MAG: aldehyde-activating protein [Gammaproteobacteria bacterium]|nr:aldehyde-activating protein [Gammaproteobacteria bacterium]MDE2274100.1 aldehyde-activating protein [Gammaproteobacteria bacterium]
MLFTGHCHCGNIRFEFETTHTKASLPLRACQCSFCRAHGALSVSDARGRVRFTIAERSLVQHYRFGLGITDMLICRRCGCYVAGVMQIDGRFCATLNVNLFDLRTELAATPAPADYADETPEQRTARRRQNWTPAEFG